MKTQWASIRGRFYVWLPEPLALGNFLRLLPSSLSTTNAVWRPVALKLGFASESPGGLVKSQIAWLHPRVVHPAGQQRGLIIC